MNSVFQSSCGVDVVPNVAEHSSTKFGQCEDAYEENMYIYIYMYILRTPVGDGHNSIYVYVISNVDNLEIGVEFLFFLYNWYQISRHCIQSLCIKVSDINVETIKMFKGSVINPFLVFSTF